MLPLQQNILLPFIGIAPSTVACAPACVCLKCLYAIQTDYMVTQAALARALNIAAGRTGSVLCACLAQLTSTVSCPAYSHIHQQYMYSYLFHQAPSSV